MCFPFEGTSKDVTPIGNLHNRIGFRHDNNRYIRYRFVEHILTYVRTMFTKVKRILPKAIYIGVLRFP